MRYCKEMHPFGMTSLAFGGEVCLVEINVVITHISINLYILFYF